MTDLTCGNVTDDDVDTNLSANPTFDSVLAARLSRRSILKGSFGLAATTFFGGAVGTAMAANYSAPNGNAKRSLKLNFNAVAKSLADVVAVPAGYTATVMYRLGDPINAATPDYRNDGTDDAASYANRAGDQHDGMVYFGMNGNGRYAPEASNRGLLCMNHEAIVSIFLHPSGPSLSGVGASRVRTSRDEVLKEMYAHGASVIEVRRSRSSFEYRKDSPLNRRITTLTDMQLSGPAARSRAMITAYSPDGSRTRGTINNCASGYTPWGTYLTCEENWAGYFRRIASADVDRTAKEKVAFARYGVNGNGRELWATVTDVAGESLFKRWNAMRVGSSEDGSDDFRNVPNTFGWNVEIDPFNPTSTPKKRTAMGRFAHEGAWPGPVVAGEPLVWYMGCDSRNEYIYKYVSNKVWNPADIGGGTAAGDKYLDDGKLYVARFNADGSGIWLELRFGINNITAANAAYPFADQADVAINTRLAADAAGATKMDRPEWGAVNPANGEVYMTLTNGTTAARPVDRTDAANPRIGNPNGHVIRWAETGAKVTATSFLWDVFLFGARSSDSASYNLSNLTAANDFSSPDGLWFANSGLLWIQTDDGAYTDVTNCMMLAAIPGRVGDGKMVTLSNTGVDSVSRQTVTRQVNTFVGAPLGETNLRRFLVGPKDCEITGVTETPDGRTLFVNVQHPGEDTPASVINQPAAYNSHWPDGGMARPRSATIVITRNDGGMVGADAG